MVFKILDTYKDNNKRGSCSNARILNKNYFQVGHRLLGKEAFLLSQDSSWLRLHPKSMKHKRKNG